MIKKVDLTPWALARSENYTKEAAFQCVIMHGENVVIKYGPLTSFRPPFDMSYLKLCALLIQNWHCFIDFEPYTKAIAKIPSIITSLTVR